MSTYIGETDNLSRRSSNYRNPGPSQKTNIRMNSRLLAHFVKGGYVEISTVTTAKLTVGGDELLLDPTQKVHRRLLENAALVSNPKAELIENL